MIDWLKKASEKMPEEEKENVKKMKEARKKAMLKAPSFQFTREFAFVD